MLVIALVSIILLAWVLFRYRQGNNKQHHKPKHHHEPHTYHCVTIETGAQCCNAVEKLAKKRFLSVDAPLFPLENCQAQDCQCHYTHYEDRRDEHGSRRSDVGLSHDLFDCDGQLNRRQKKSDRRVNHRPAY
jgi:hypothetical protein